MYNEKRKFLFNLRKGKNMTQIKYLKENVSKAFTFYLERLGQIFILYIFTLFPSDLINSLFNQEKSIEKKLKLVFDFLDQTFRFSKDDLLNISKFLESGNIKQLLTNTEIFHYVIFISIMLETLFW